MRIVSVVVGGAPKPTNRLVPVTLTSGAYM